MNRRARTLRSRRSASLRPAFKKDGTVTAGNAPGTNDGAAALVVTSEATPRAWARRPWHESSRRPSRGVEPKWMMMAPVEAVEKLLEKTGWDRDRDVDLYELNEAFAVQAHRGDARVASRSRESECKWRRRGHRASHWRFRRAHLVTLLYEMQRRNVHRGIAALCLGGGNAVALAVER